VFELAVRRGWVTANPCKLVDAPEVEPSHEIRFLSQAELETLLAHGIPDDELGVLERPLYLMAAMTGLRQGELLGLRWLDLDAEARKVRVRRAWVRGEFKSPKSRRGSAGPARSALPIGRRSWRLQVLWGRAVAGANPVSPTQTSCSSFGPCE
jgi:integrase